MTNAERQAKWREKHKPKQLKANVDKELAEQFKLKLGQHNEKFQPWLVERINQYLKGK